MYQVGLQIVSLSHLSRILSFDIADEICPFFVNNKVIN